MKGGKLLIFTEKARLEGGVTESQFSLIKSLEVVNKRCYVIDEHERRMVGCSVAALVCFILF